MMLQIFYQIWIKTIIQMDFIIMIKKKNRFISSRTSILFDNHVAIWLGHLNIWILQLRDLHLINSSAT
jgi:hypothetical protein